MQNKEGKHDPEMHQACKGNQWSFGMKLYTGVDKDSGWIHQESRDSRQDSGAQGGDAPRPDTPEGRLQDLIEAAKAHIRSKVEHPFQVIKQQFGFQKTRLRGLAKSRCKINVLAALTNLVLARRTLLATA